MWQLTLTYSDNTSEVMYYTTRQEARTGSQFYRMNWMADGPKIGKSLVSISAPTKVGE